MNAQEKTLNELRTRLGAFKKRDIRDARAKLFDKVLGKSRCWNKLQEIDKKFHVCKNINIFLDLCGGPGEFAKFTMNANPFSKGFGISLSNNLTCKYQRALTNRKNFTQILGPNMTGDIMDKDVIFEMSLTCGDVCDLVLADGSVDVTGVENQQEKFNFDLILCETQLILIALRTGGSSILKIFDTFTDDTIKALNKFVGHFEKWCLYKPPSSRRANSEKYLICLNKLFIPKDVDQSNLLKSKLRTFTKRQCRYLETLNNTLMKSYEKKNV
jgi:cap1 methyltransferase